MTHNLPPQHSLALGPPVSSGGDCGVLAPHSAPKKPSGDSCQAPGGGGRCQRPSPHRPLRLVADPTTLDDKHPPEPPDPMWDSEQEQGRREGGGDGPGGQDVRREVRTEPPARCRPQGPLWALTYQARSSLGTVAGAHGADREREQAAGGSQTPLRRPQAPRWRWEEGTAGGAAVSSSACVHGGREGWAGGRGGGDINI